MTVQSTDVWREFRNLLPPQAARGLHDTQRAVVLVHRAIGTHGWTAAQLARECSRDLAGVANAGAVVTFRLEQCAEHAPPTSPGGATRPFCGRCDHGWIYTTPEDPDAPLTSTRCECRRANA